MSLAIQNLYITADNKEIIHGLDLTLEKGKVIALMGPNGSGKSTLANTLMGHPKYTVTQGEIILDGENITALSPDKRAKKGLFLSMQYPPQIEGVTIGNFLRVAKVSQTGVQISPLDFHKILIEKMEKLSIDPDFLKRYLNVGFSGGEKKKLEILQLAILEPTYAILDETDSGLDVDALRIVAEGINQFRSPERGILLITHYNRILEYITPDVVYIMKEGRIVKSGGAELAREIEESGYSSFRGVGDEESFEAPLLP